jgi:transposase
MGRSRGGLTTKIHALVDACGLPIRLKITEGQAHDGRSAQDMIDTVEREDVLLADRAYDSNALRQTLAARGATANVKPMPNRVVALRFNRGLYRKCNLVERFFNESSTIARSPSATTKVTTTSSLPSSSPQSVSGCDLMSR